MFTFVRLTLIVALGIAVLLVLAFVVKIVAIAAILAALVIAAAFVLNFTRRLGRRDRPMVVVSRSKPVDKTVL